MRSYLIKETTKEERQKNVDEALAISSMDALPPSNEVMKLVQSYIDGNMELDEIKELY